LLSEPESERLVELIKNRLQFAALCGSVLLLVYTASAQNNQVFQVADSIHPHERTFQFEYKATVKDIPVDAKQVDVWIPVPHDSPFQRITDLQIESPYPYHTNTAQYGNQVLHISLNRPQQSTLTVTVRFNTVRIEHLQVRLREESASAVKGERDPDMARWLQPDRLVPIDGKDQAVGSRGS